ncbi:hypothetical protein GCM10009678_42470 [Actinomadura kijaniata]|uniref:Acyl-coenzyme A thioesterase THEM4 n=1 Tax=Actinomadura namibiensis TaxID=182080 RepID=A0A7W3LU35_ACTNM|nr:PaaI family thioesterase [Actinomadura namibiensis]MBA8954361.1 acyl-coenzyme A thioesterase PaaI-like protein [Actinomadura namibiensis]
MTTPSVDRLPAGPASSRTTPPPGAAVPEEAGPDPRLTDGVLAGYAGCFGCGEESPHGLRLRRTGHADGVVRAEYVVQRAHQGAPGLAHGGVLATAMDEMLGWAAWLLGRRYVTGRLETDFLRPVPVGATLHLRAWCRGVDGRKAYLEGEGRVGAPDGPPAVRAAGLFVEVPREHFTKERMN